MAITVAFRRRSLVRVVYLVAAVISVRWLFFSGSTPSNEIKHHNVIERVTRADKTLDVQKYPFLQSRLGRDERPDLLSEYVNGGVSDFWTRFQLPFMTSPDTAHVDAQAVRSAIENLLSLNGWVAAACPTLNRPFGQNKRDDAYDDLASANRHYFIAIVVHSADHFLVDQLAVIVQLARRLGTQNLFVSVLDYDSRDSTPTLTDLSEAVLTLLGVPFRIRRVPPMFEDESAGYYPLEEAYTRNLVLEPLHELDAKRKIKFDKVIWLKGFTCPNDVLETIKVSNVNRAAMVCGMDWAEHNGFFIFSDRWRTRDMDGDQFRQSKSSSTSSVGPPRDEVGAARYAQHLPFQVFCCESGTHVVDPFQTYYRGIEYRSSVLYHNTSSLQPPPKWDPEGECMDSSQAWFCRDIWVEAARSGLRAADQPSQPGYRGSEWDPEPKAPIRRREAEKKEEIVEEKEVGKEQVAKEEEKVPAHPPPQGGPKGIVPPADADANAGSDYDAMPDSSPPPLEDSRVSFEVPNSHFSPGRILINPRCVTTYAGVSHTRLASDLFGPDKEDDVLEYDSKKYVLEEWGPAPDSFVCQEQKQTGGRQSTKMQRRLGFSVATELEARGLL